MSRLTISCESCDHVWLVATTFSVYEQQAVESCPCPHCGACTLRLAEPEEARPRRLRRARGAAPVHA